MKLSSIKRDVSSAENGVWITNAIGNLDLKIAAIGNKKYTDMLRRLVKPYKRTLESKGDEFFMDLQSQCIAKTVLLGWRNMEADDSTEDNPKYVEYSSDVAYELLKDPENHEFRELVISLAEEEEVFRKESVEDAMFQAE